MTVFSGQIVDRDSGAGIPSATVQAWVGNLMLAGVAADGNGNFTISTNAVPDTVKVSSVGYSDVIYPYAPLFSNPQMYTSVPLAKNIKEEDNVTVTATKVSPVVWIGAGLLLLLLLSKKR